MEGWSPGRWAAALLVALAALGLVSCGGDGGPTGPVIGPTPEGLVLRLLPSSQTVTKGTTFSASVHLFNAQSVFGTAFEIGFDPSKLEAVGAESGPFLPDAPLFFSFFEAGTASIAVVRKAPERAISGSGELARLELRALAQGDVELRFRPQMTAIEDPTGAPIPGRADLQHEGAVVIVQ